MKRRNFFEEGFARGSAVAAFCAAAAPKKRGRPAGTAAKKVRRLTKAAMADVKKEIHIFLKSKSAGSQLSDIKKHIARVKKMSLESGQVHRLLKDPSLFTKTGQRRGTVYKAVSKK